MGITGHIIEGDYSKYDYFVELYNNPNLSVLDIKREVGTNAYTKLKREALKNNDITLRPTVFNINENLYKFYHFDKQRGKYRVHKVKKGVYMSFGFYETEEEAKIVVEELKKVGWDKSKLDKEFVEKWLK